MKFKEGDIVIEIDMNNPIELLRVVRAGLDFSDVCYYKGTRVLGWIPNWTQANTTMRAATPFLEALYGV